MVCLHHALMKDPKVVGFTPDLDYPQPAEQIVGKSMLEQSSPISRAPQRRTDFTSSASALLPFVSLFGKSGDMYLTPLVLLS